MASTTTTTSQFILDHLGGPENIRQMSHCATRLRFQLDDVSKVDDKALDSDPKVLGTVPQGDHGYQVVMGGSVANYYQELLRLPGMEHFGDSTGGGPKRDASGKKQYEGVRGRYDWVDYAFEFLSDTFRPILWALLGASLIITLLVLADTFGLQDFRADMADQPDTYVFMHAMWRSVFYFLPIMVGATAARKLGANEWVGAAIAAAFLTPEFLALGEAGDTVQVFGLPMVLNGYAGQVFPPLIAAIGLFWVEKLLKWIIPEAVQMVFVPFFSLLIMIPATGFLLGPFGIGIGNGISDLLYAVNDFSPFILAIIVPMLYPFLVPLGLHWPLNAIMIQNINTLGYDFIQGPMGAWNFACFGVVTGVLIISLREHNKQMRQVSMGGMLAGLLGGISEPSLYGVLLRFKKTYLRLLPGCFAGGVVMGIFDVKASAFVFTSLLTIPAMDPMPGYAIGLAVAFFTSFFLVVFFDYRGVEEKKQVLADLAEAREAEALEADGTADDTADDAAEADAAPAAATAAAPAAATATDSDAATEEREFSLTAPLEGTAVALSEIPDPMFAGERLGKGIAIIPSGDTVFAPADGKVLTVQKSGHAVGLALDNGVQLLVHIGIDTVEMAGKGFEVLVEKKQRVTRGTPLIKFDRATIEEAGFNPITPVLITNTRKFESVTGLPTQAATVNTKVIDLVRKAPVAAE
ncbi:glucose PTS transporter subunit IIA [Corynebacterium ulceribovis]|uniref:glucose PTS transporter subunit IIA n=1 Tax=Corynebacterium ulceribovis TaxID=487732 RepID=UPI00036F427D|nr:glucose PTS transporter subunit IIA [Corynebacterium ulceribovis]